MKNAIRDSLFAGCFILLLIIIIVIMTNSYNTSILRLIVKGILIFSLIVFVLRLLFNKNDY